MASSNDQSLDIKEHKTETATDTETAKPAEKETEPETRTVAATVTEIKEKEEEKYEGVVLLEQLPVEHVFDGTEKVPSAASPRGVCVVGVGVGGEEETKKQESPRASVGSRALDLAKSIDWPEKANAVKSFVVEQKSAVSNAIRRLSGRGEDHENEAVTTVDQVDGAGSPKAGPLNYEVWGEKIRSSLNFRRNSPRDPQEVGNTKEGAENVSVGGGGDEPELTNEPKMKGRITLFSRSGCSDSKAVRSLLRGKELFLTEINVDVYPQRRMELEERTGTSSVPQVFFNATFLGGIEELKLLASNGELDEKIKEVFENEPPSTAPLPPEYGVDEPESSMPDEFAEVMRKFKEKVQVKDRFYKMRLFRNCFTGSEAVDFLAEEQYCERDEAIEFGRKLVAKHFFRHVLEENIFEDGNHLYRFLEHDPVISSKCYNFSRINDMEPRPAAEVEKSLTELISAIFEIYISDDGRHVDYRGISKSEEFRRYVKMIECLQRIDLHLLKREEKLALFINLYNAMSIHAIILHGHPTGPLDRRKFFGDFQYVIGGYPYSLSAIQNGILRGNQRPPYTLTKPFGQKDKRLPVAFPEVERLTHFALTLGCHSSPPVRCYSSTAIDVELRMATRNFFEDGGIIINAETKTVSVSKILKWYSVDFGKNEVEVLTWSLNHLDPRKADDLIVLLDGNEIKVVYQPYDWAPNL